MSKTIKSTSTEGRTITVHEPSDTEFLLDINGRSRRFEGSIFVNRADLFAALGIDKLGCGCDDADENLTTALKRAEAAEATLEKVREWRDGEEQFDKLDAILNPVPPFTLPTEAGSRFEADMRQNGETRTFTTFTGGGNTLYAYEDERYGWYVYDAKGVFADFTGHRLIGADE